MHPVVRALLQSGGYETYLYNEGDEYTALTGVWSSVLISGTVTRTKNADNLLVQPTAANSDGMFVTTNTVDLTDYAKLKIEYIGAGTNGWIALSAGSNKTEDAYPTRETNVAGAALTDSATRAITEVDIASITGSHYIKIGSAVGAITGAYVNVYKVWLE